MDKKYCSKCGSRTCGYGITIRMASVELLKSIIYYNLIWKPIDGLQLSRQGTREEIINVFCWNCCINLQNAEGEKIVLPEFDDVFPEDDSCTWFGRFLAKNPTDTNLPKRYYNAPRYQGKYIPALQVMDVAAKLIDPEPFRKIGQIC